MVRKIMAVLAGLVTAFVVIAILEYLAFVIHPLPEGVSMKDSAAMKQHAMNAPITALLAVLLGYILGAFTAGLVSTAVANDGKNSYAIICAMIFTAFTIYNVVSIPSPWWFMVIAIGCWFPMGVAGYKQALKRRRVK